MKRTIIGLMLATALSAFGDLSFTATTTTNVTTRIAPVVLTPAQLDTVKAGMAQAGVGLGLPVSSTNLQSVTIQRQVRGTNVVFVITVQTR